MITVSSKDITFFIMKKKYDGSNPSPATNCVCVGMVDNPVLEAGAMRRESSSLSRRTWSLAISKLIVPLTALGKIAACSNYDMQFS